MPWKKKGKVNNGMATFLTGVSGYVSNVISRVRGKTAIWRITGKVTIEHQTTKRPDAGFLGQPKGLIAISVTQAFERFCHYGILNILVLYFVSPRSNGGLGMESTEAVSTFGIYVAVIYMLSAPGGMLADRMTGLYNAVLIGGGLIVLGCFVMTIPGQVAIWPGLIMISAGTGLLKPNIAALVGKLYEGQETGQARRDVGYSIVFASYNFGAALATLLCGYIGRQYGWSYGFAVAGTGMIISIVVFILFAKRSIPSTGKKVMHPLSRAERTRAIWIIVCAVGTIGSLSTVLALFELLSIGLVTTLLTVVILLTPILLFARILRNSYITSTERRQVRSFIWVFLGGACFVVLQSQTQSLLIIFMQNHVLRMIDNFRFPVSWELVINPITIMIVAPTAAIFWSKLGNRGPNMLAKFVSAILLVGMSFLIMAALAFVARAHLLDVGWVALVIIFQAVAQVLLSPTGQAESSRLAPRGMDGQMLALWFLTVAIGYAVGGQIARLEPLLGYPTYFAIFGTITVVLGIAMLLGRNKLGLIPRED